MKPCWPQQLLSLVLIFSFSLVALGSDGADESKAVLHASGNVQVNGTDGRKITTLFPGDTIQTGEDSVADITAGGSSVRVMPNASVKFLGNSVELTQGRMAITTSAGMTALAYGLTVTPTAQTLSKFEVAEDKDSVVIAARQGNVAVSDGQQTSTVPEGQQTTLKKKKKKEGGAAPAASGGNSGKTLAIIGAAAAGATVAGIVIAGGQAGCGGTPVVITGSMEGNLPIEKGDTVKAGYDFTMPGNHASATVAVSCGMVQVFEDCRSITITLPPQTYSVAQNNNNWVPSGDQSSPLVYQGNAKTTCTGHAPKGATFTANFSDMSSTKKCDTVNVRFHYSDKSSGSWSSSVTAISPQKCASPPCNCKSD